MEAEPRELKADLPTSLLGAIAVALQTCLLVSTLCAESVARQTPTTSAGPARRFVLVYSGGPARPAYSLDDLVHLIAFVDTTDQAKAWLCDAAIFLEFHAPSGRYLMPWTSGYVPSNGRDWSTYLDSILAASGPVSRLDSTVGKVTEAIGGAARRFALVVMIPYPDPRSDTLRFQGRIFRFGDTRERAAAVDAYVDEVLRRIRAMHLTRLDFLGFYWVNEGVTALDTAVVTHVAASLHGRNLQFYWIPAFQAAGAEKWRALGFDQAWIQPNYFFHPEIPATRLDSAVSRAREAGTGLEVELDRRMFGSWQYRDRLEPYLSALEVAPDLRSRPIAIYEGAGALIQLARSRETWYRALYERLANVLRAPAPGVGAP